MKELKYVKIPNVVLRIKELTPLQRLALMTMIGNERNGKIENVTQQLLAYTIGTKKENISIILKTLIEKGYIQKIKSGAWGETNVYAVNWDKINESAKETDYYESKYNKDNEIKITDTEEKKEENMGQYIGTVNEIQARNENREQWGERVKTAFQEKAVVAVAAAEVPKVPEYIIREMEKCIPKMKLNSMMMQMSKSLSDEKNIQRLEECLSPYIEGFSKVEREYLYKKLLYHFKNKSEQAA